MKKLQEKESKKTIGDFIIKFCTIILIMVIVSIGVLYYKGYSDGVKAREAEAAVAN